MLPDAEIFQLWTGYQHTELLVSYNQLEYHCFVIDVRWH